MDKIDLLLIFIVVGIAMMISVSIIVGVEMFSDVFDKKNDKCDKNNDNLDKIDVKEDVDDV